MLAHEEENHKLKLLFSASPQIMLANEEENHNLMLFFSASRQIMLAHQEENHKVDFFSALYMLSHLYLLRFKLLQPVAAC